MPRAEKAVQMGLWWPHTSFSDEAWQFSCFGSYNQLECLTFHDIWWPLILQSHQMLKIGRRTLLWGLSDRRDARWPLINSVTHTMSCGFSGSLFPSSQGRTLDSIISQDFSGVTDVAWWVISEQSDQGRLDMGWAPWGWLQPTIAALQHHEGCFSAFRKETDGEGQCGKLCAKLKLAQEEQERQRGKRPVFAFWPDCPSTPLTARV